METGLLIASPQMEDPFFAKAVVLLCQTDESGAMGVVINRETGMTVAEVLRQMDLPESERSESLVLWGGPVGESAGFVVFRGLLANGEGWQLSQEVAVSPSRELLQAALAGDAPFHLCLGYAGWAAAQLEQEIASGSWLFAELDPSIIFDVPVSMRYDRALALLGLGEHELWMHPVDE